MKNELICLDLNIVISCPEGSRLLKVPDTAVRKIDAAAGEWTLPMSSSVAINTYQLIEMAE